MNNDVCRRVGSMVLVVIGMMGVVGCHQSANPWQDRLAQRPPATTPSVDAARAMDRAPSTRIRSHVPIDLDLHDTNISHGPLYFIDPLECDTHDDGRFAWTGEDYGQFVVAPIRFYANIILYPIHAVMTSPWSFLHSDGGSSPSGR